MFLKILIIFLILIIKALRNRKKPHISLVGNERRDITTDPIDIKR